MSGWSPEAAAQRRDPAEEASGSGRVAAFSGGVARPTELEEAAHVPVSRESFRLRERNAGRRRTKRERGSRPVLANGEDGARSRWLGASAAKALGGESKREGLRQEVGWGKSAGSMDWIEQVGRR